MNYAFCTTSILKLSLKVLVSAQMVLGDRSIISMRGGSLNKLKIQNQDATQDLKVMALHAQRPGKALIR